jgi:hypothetical protein
MGVAWAVRILPACGVDFGRGKGWVCAQITEASHHDQPETGWFHGRKPTHDRGGWVEDPSEKASGWKPAPTFAAGLVESG